MEYEKKEQINNEGVFVPQMGIEYPEILGSTNDTISIKIDSGMRELRSLMDCFFDALSTNYWKIITDDSNIIKLKIC